MAAFLSASSSSSSSFLSLAKSTRPLILQSHGNPRTELYLIEPLGVGSFSVCIWRAIHRPSGSLVAVKICESAVGEGEVSILSTLPQHPNIIHLDTFWSFEGQTWLSMQAMECSLQELLVESGGALQESLIAEVLVLMLRGVEALHAAGITHRDVKPSNILLSLEGGLALTDFGAAVRFLGTTSAASSQRALMGTPLYLAPEIIARSEQAANPAGDVWSIGIFSLELFGCAPFAGLSVINAIFTICTAPPPSLPHGTSASPAFRDFLEKILVRDPLLRAPPAHLLAHPFLESATAIITACEGLSPALAEAMDASLPGIVAARREAIANGPRPALPAPPAGVAAASAAGGTSVSLPSTTSSLARAKKVLSTTTTFSSSSTSSTSSSSSSPAMVAASTANTQSTWEGHVETFKPLPVRWRTNSSNDELQLDALFAQRQLALQKEWEQARQELRRQKRESNGGGGGRPT